MKTILLILLLLPVVGWAEDDTLVIKKRFIIKDSSGTDLVTCKADNLDDCRIVDVGGFLDNVVCADKMREALQELDRIGVFMIYQDPVDGIGREFRISMNEGQYHRIFKQTRECVHETK